MKSHNFHTELSILSFLLLWTVSQFASFCHCFIGPQDPNDVQIKIITAAEKRCSEDTSRMAETGDYLEMHYTGRLNAENGNKFDASWDRGKPIKFQLGAEEVIQGWEKGLIGMCVGETRTLTVPPHLGYGDEGSSGIPGGATLHFTVDLRAVAKGKLKIKTEEQKRRERDYF